MHTPHLHKNSKHNTKTTITCADHVSGLLLATTTNSEDRGWLSIYSLVPRPETARLGCLFISLAVPNEHAKLRWLNIAGVCVGK